VASSTENATDGGGGADFIEKVAVRSVCGVEGGVLQWQGWLQEWGNEFSGVVGGVIM